MEEADEVLQELEDCLADSAKRTVEDELEQKINTKLQERHLDYDEIRMQVLKEAGPDNARTRRVRGTGALKPQPVQGYQRFNAPQALKR